MRSSFNISNTNSSFSLLIFLISFDVFSLLLSFIWFVFNWLIISPLSLPPPSLLLQLILSETLLLLTSPIISSFPFVCFSFISTVVWFLSSTVSPTTFPFPPPPPLNSIPRKRLPMCFPISNRFSSYSISYL